MPTESVTQEQSRYIEVVTKLWDEGASSPDTAITTPRLIASLCPSPFARGPYISALSHLQDRRIARIVGRHDIGLVWRVWLDRDRLAELQAFGTFPHFELSEF